MFELVLIYEGENGTEEIPVENERFSFGRGSDADRRFEDPGLSRLHATVYQEGDRVWVVDERSSNGTFVNGAPVSGGGTPLEDGDEIRIGNETTLVVSFREPEAEEQPEEDNAPVQTVESAPDSGKGKRSMLLPAILLGVAIIVIGASVIIAGVIIFGGGKKQTAMRDFDFDDPTFADPTPETSATPGPESTTPTPFSTNGMGTGNGSTNGPIDPIGGPELPPIGNQQNLPSGLTYQQMSEAQKNEYVKVKAEMVSRVIGNSSGQSIPSEATAKIRRFLDAYVSKIKRSRKNDCTMGGWQSSDMTSILLRAKENAPFIIRAFNEKGIDPQVGLYLAMIESEHCPCLQSPTGPLGLFQFTRATGKRYGLETKAGASPSNPDERCIKEPAAKAAAAYMKSLSGRIGTGPLSIPLAIASYNSGEGGLGKNLRVALEANQGQDRSFWTLVANSEKLAEQFQRENIKYVPKFFAAAIIGENPKDFGIDLLPLSLYTK